MKSRFAIVIACFIFIFSNNISYSQTINRYLFLHQNNKNDPQIKSSPLSSGYYRDKAVEFSYEPVPTEAMKKRIKSIFGDKIYNDNEEEDDDISKILGNSNMDEFSFGEQSTIIQELDDEGNQAIIKQESEKEKAYLEKRKINVASYAASVEAKKKRDLESANKPKPEKQEIKPISPWDYYEETEDENASDTFEIISGKDGKIKIKTPASNPVASSTNQQTPPPNPQQQPIASATIINKK